MIVAEYQFSSWIKIHPLFQVFRRFRGEAEAAVRCMEKNLAECLRYYDFDRSMWKSIRTTNIFERAFREVRSRTRPMNLFPNADSANRIFYGVTKNLNQSWNKEPLKEFPQSG